MEDISLRSTRIRTPDRTELSIPNGSLATMNVENLSRRDKFLFNTKLGLRYETSPDQMRYVLAQVRRLLYEHPKVETDGARNRFIAFDASALSMEIFCYILTRDYNEFLAIREDLLLRIMDIVDAAGTGFAFPSQTLYLSRDAGVDKEKAERVARQVRNGGKAISCPFLTSRKARFPSSATLFPIRNQVRRWEAISRLCCASALRLLELRCRSSPRVTPRRYPCKVRLPAQRPLVISPSLPR